MKRLFTFLVGMLSIANTFGQRDPNQNPYWLIEDLKTKGISYKSSGQISIGKANNESIFLGPKSVNHVLKTISVTIPSGATITKIHPFIFNIDGLKAPGGEPNAIPWGITPDIDYRWGTFHTPQMSILSSGETVVSVEYDNWSDIETRAGFLIVEYSGGNPTVTTKSPTTTSSNSGKNSVKFYNPKGTSRNVFLYVVEVDHSSTFEFCASARFVGEIEPGEEVYESVSNGNVLYWSSYTVHDCTYGNNYAATGSTTGTCPGLCVISINAQ